MFGCDAIASMIASGISTGWTEDSRTRSMPGMSATATSTSASRAPPLPVSGPYAPTQTPVTTSLFCSLVGHLPGLGDDIWNGRLARVLRV